MFEEALIFLDNDKAGIVGTETVYSYLQDMMKVECITQNMPEEKDPAICTRGQISSAILKAYKKRGAYLKEWLTRL